MQVAVSSLSPVNIHICKKMLEFISLDISMLTVLQI